VSQFWADDRVFHSSERIQQQDWRFAGRCGQDATGMVEAHFGVGSRRPGHGTCATRCQCPAPKWWTGSPFLRFGVPEVFLGCLEVVAGVSKGHHGIHKRLECGCDNAWCHWWRWSRYWRKVQIPHCHLCAPLCLVLGRGLWVAVDALEGVVGTDPHRYGNMAPIHEGATSCQ
jgi:hypothetical protein